MRTHMLWSAAILVIVPGVARAQLQEMRQTIFGMD